MQKKFLENFFNYYPYISLPRNFVRRLKKQKVGRCVIEKMQNCSVDVLWVQDFGSVQMSTLFF